MYTGYEVVYFVDMDVVNWMMNESILGCLISEFMERIILGYGVVLCI